MEAQDESAKSKQAANCVFGLQSNMTQCTLMTPQGVSDVVHKDMNVQDALVRQICHDNSEEDDNLLLTCLL